MYAASEVMAVALGEGLYRLKSTVRSEGFLDGINVNLKGKGQPVQFDLERGRVRQVYLPKTRYACINTSPAFNPDLWRVLIKLSNAQLQRTRTTTPSDDFLFLCFITLSFIFNNRQIYETLFL